VRWHLAHNYDLVVQGMYQRQGGYREAVYGAGLRMHLNRNLYKEMALQISLDFRHHFRDALIPRVDFFKTWQIGFNDVTALSEVKTITKTNAVDPRFQLVIASTRSNQFRSTSPASFSDLIPARPTG
jgi:hypothetical protein